MTINTIIQIVGGLGLLLLGMKLMTDGLKLAGGPILRKVLGKWTRSRFRGLLSGFMLTSLVQFSGAVTVAALGFVNAGMLSLSKAVWVVYGSNIGTTTTAWIVAFLGLKLNIKVLALPFIGLGTAMWLSGGVSRRTSLGEALAGFGLFFLGIEFLQSTLLGLGTEVSFHTLASHGLLGQVVFLGVGFLLTCVMQSSSASMALILTATATNVVTLGAAAAAVIGANVGTTSTAAFVVIGATPNAKRLAMVHVFFNILTGIVAFACLPLLLDGILGVREFLGMDDAPATVLALFHTIFNTLGVLLMWPISKYLVRWIKKRFRTPEEEQGRPIYLDKTIVRTPSLALNALLMEAGRIGEVGRRMARATLKCDQEECPELNVEKNILTRLQIKSGKFAATMSREGLSQASSERLPEIMRISQYFYTAAEMSLEAEKSWANLEPITDETLQEQIDATRDSGVDFVVMADPEDSSFSQKAARESLVVFENSYQALKQLLLECGTSGLLNTEQMVGWLEYFSRLHRMVQQIYKAALLHSRLRDDETFQIPNVEEEERKSV